MTAGVKPWREIRARGKTPEQLAALDRAVRDEVLALDLKDLRTFLGISQAKLAELAKMNQPDVSRLESRDDYLMSTLRRVVNALGGELEVVAVFGNRRLVLRTTRVPDDSIAPSDTASRAGRVGVPEALKKSLGRDTGRSSGKRGRFGRSAATKKRQGARS